MDNYTWEHNTDSPPSDLSVDDILAEFQFDLPVEPKTAAPEAPAPVFHDVPIAAPRIPISGKPKWPKISV